MKEERKEKRDKRERGEMRKERLLLGHLVKYFINEGYYGCAIYPRKHGGEVYYWLKETVVLLRIHRGEEVSVVISYLDHPVWMLD